MSVLVLGARGSPGEPLIDRLVRQGDDVRVVEQDDAPARRWSELGARVARGSPLDEDLLARAAEGARTIVVLEDPRHEVEDVVATARAATHAPAGAARLVICARGLSSAMLDAVDGTAGEHVVLLPPARPWGRRRNAALDEALAVAIDAADDLTGAPRLVLDLGLRESWLALGLEFRAGSGRPAR